MGNNDAKLRQNRLIEVYEYLRGNCGIHTKSQMAQVMGIGRTSISAAFSGNPDYLTDSLFTKICAAYPGVFDSDYLLTGKGSLLVEGNNECDKDVLPHSEYGSLEMFNMVLTAKDETIEALRQQLALKDEIIQAKDQLIASLRHQIPYNTIDEPYLGVAEGGVK